MLHQILHMGVHAGLKEFEHSKSPTTAGAVAGMAIAGVMGATLLPAVAIIGAGAAIGAGINALRSKEQDDASGS